MKLSQLFYDIPVETEVPDQEIEGFSCDSRKITKNMLFVALEKSSRTRQAYIEEAISQGASAILCPLADQKRNIPHGIYSKCPRYDYGLLSANWFGNPAKQLILIGVTGTNGKTTTTHIVKSMLEDLADGRERKVGLIGTNENKIGTKTLKSHRTTPDAYELHSLLAEMVAKNCTYAIMEVSSHGLVQHRTAGLQFEVGVFTNLTQDHLDYHSSMEEYEKAKKLLWDQSNIAVINLDDGAGQRYALHRKEQKQPCFTYSENKTEANLSSENINLAAKFISFNCICQNRRIPVHLPIPGGFSLYNALAALTCGLALELPLTKLSETFGKMEGVKGRIEVLPTPSDFTVIIDYAHTPNALENILTTARELTENRLICLFGCGGNRDSSKRSIMGEIAEDLSDIVVITSDNPRFEEPEEIISEILQGMSGKKEAKVEVNRKKAIFWALSQGTCGDLILLAGKGHECYQEIRGQQSHMDEREIVQEYFSLRDAKKD